jgi:hypothetical protein
MNDLSVRQFYSESVRKAKQNQAPVRPSRVCNAKIQRW